MVLCVSMALVNFASPSRAQTPTTPPLPEATVPPPSREAVLEERLRRLEAMEQRNLERAEAAERKQQERYDALLKEFQNLQSKSESASLPIPSLINPRGLGFDFDTVTPAPISTEEASSSRSGTGLPPDGTIGRGTPSVAAPPVEPEGGGVDGTDGPRVGVDPYAAPDANLLGGDTSRGGGRGRGAGGTIGRRGTAGESRPITTTIGNGLRWDSEEIGDQLQLRSGGGDHVGVDPVGDGGGQHLGPANGLDQGRGVHRVIVQVQLGVEQLPHPGLHRIGQFACHHDLGFANSH